MSEQADLLLRALLDEERLLILGCLALSTAALPALHTQTGLKEAALLRHLGLLQQVGLVKTEVSAGEVTYQFHSTAVQALKRTLFAPAQRPAADNVVARFVQAERLVALPVQASKLTAVLGWLVERFEHGRIYTEPEIKELLAPHAIDDATLRRLLVDHGLLQRDKGRYWRVPNPTP